MGRKDTKNNNKHTPTLSNPHTHKKKKEVEEKSIYYVSCHYGFPKTK